TPAFHHIQFILPANTVPTGINTLSLHDALPISTGPGFRKLSQPEGEDRKRLGNNFHFSLPPTVTAGFIGFCFDIRECLKVALPPDRKSTRLNSSHQIISYAVFCLKKKLHHKTTD